MKTSLNPIALLCISLIPLSCTRQKLNQRVASDPKKNITQWLSLKKPEFSNQNWYDSLSNSLDWSRIEISHFSTEENIATVPLTVKAKTVGSHINSVGADYLAVILNKHTGNVRMGNLVKILEQHNGLSHARSVADIYNNKNTLYQGYFTVSDLSGKIAFEVNYKNGTLTSYSRPVKGKAAESLGTRTQTTMANICTDWFLVTTYYYSDGSSITEREYLYTTCTGTGTPEGHELDGGGSYQNVDLVTVNPVQNNISDPCLNSMINSVTNNPCLENYITSLYQSTFVGYGHQMNLVLAESNTLSHAAESHLNATTGVDDTIYFNKSFFSNPANVAQELWTAAFAHELIHSFIQTTSVGNSLYADGIGQHQQMIMNWIDNFSTLLTTLYPTLSTFDAKGLALSGVEDVLVGNGYCSDTSWDTFISLNYGITTADVQNTTRIYTNGSAGTHCP
jgi:hypothetical protein